MPDPTKPCSDLALDGVTDAWTVRVLFSGREIEDSRGCRLDGAVVIGRQPGEGGLKVEDGRCSRTHAVIQPMGERLTLGDLGSQNGTAVNGVPVTSVHLSDGDVIRTGDTLLCVRWGQSAQTTLSGIHGYSPAVNVLRRRLLAVLNSDEPLLLWGESGVGKRIAARAIHLSSDRAAGPFLLLQGRTTEGFATLDAARDGTVFVREVGSLTPAGQELLLEVLRREQLNVRVLASTAVDLEAAVEAGTFSKPLWDALCQAQVRVPPLRERREDVLQLLKPHLGDACGRLSADLAEELSLFDWPGNVRQIQRVAEELAVRGRGLAVLGPELFDSRLAAFRSEPEAAPLDIPDAERTPSRDELVVLLRRHHGMVARVAADLGQSIPETRVWLRAYELEPMDFQLGG